MQNIFIIYLNLASTFKNQIQNLSTNLSFNPKYNIQIFFNFILKNITIYKLSEKNSELLDSPKSI